MVSLTILTIVLGGVYGVYRETSRNLQLVQDRGILTQTARVVLGDLRRELGSVYPMSVPVDEDTLATMETGTTDPETASQDALTFAGEDAEGPDEQPADNLRFTAAVGGANRGGPARSDVAELMYYLDLDEATPVKGLVRQANYHPGLTVDETREPQTTELTPLATSFNVRFWVPEEEIPEDLQVDDEGWCVEWSSTTTLPAAVEIRLGLTPNEPNAVERWFRTVVSLPLRTPRPDLRQGTDQAEDQTPTQGAGAEPGGATDQGAADEGEAAAAAAAAMLGQLGGGDAAP